MSKKYICYNHIPTEEFLIRKVYTGNGGKSVLCMGVSVCLTIFCGDVCARVLVIFTELSRLETCSHLSSDSAWEMF